MTLYEFNVLSENKKAEATWDGVFLMSRENGTLKYSLYSISDFFVEVAYDNINNKIVGFQGFITKELLDIYLENISLNNNY